MILQPTYMPYDSDIEMARSGARITLTCGSTYVVVYNGVEYDCIATTENIDEETIVSLGNLDAVGGTGDTGEPFWIFVPDEKLAEELGASLCLVPLDGAVSIVVSIKTGSVEQIDTKFLPGYVQGKEEAIIVAEQEVTIVDGVGTIEFTDVPVIGETYEFGFVIEGGSGADHYRTTLTCAAQAGLYTEDGVDVGICMCGDLNDDMHIMCVYVYPEYVEVLGTSSALIFNGGGVDIGYDEIKFFVKRSYEPTTIDSEYLPVIPVEKLPDIPVEKLPDIPVEKLPDIPEEKLPDVAISVQPNWKQTDETAMDFIKNKPKTKQLWRTHKNGVNYISNEPNGEPMTLQQFEEIYHAYGRDYLLRIDGQPMIGSLFFTTYAVICYVDYNYAAKKWELTSAYTAEYTPKQ